MSLCCAHDPFNVKFDLTILNSGKKNITNTLQLLCKFSPN